MHSTERRCRVYDPEAIIIMGRAFDKAVRGLSEQSKTNLHIRRTLALCIFRLFDEGENSSLCISIRGAHNVILGHSAYSMRRDWL